MDLRRLMAFALAALIFMAAGPVAAQDGLTLVRAESAGGAAEVVISLDDLRALPQVLVNTDNDYQDGVNAYEGPLVRDVLEMIGRGTATTAKMTAANDYSVDIPIAEFDDFDVILALSMNGEPFSLRDKGPIWVMYPLADHAELRDPVFNTRLIWQLVRMEVM